MRALALLGTLASLLLSGCASYQMGAPADLPYRSVAVSPPRNVSDLPQIEGPLNGALRKAIQASESLELATGAAADALLEVSVVEVRREIAAVSSDDVGRGRKFTLEVTLELDLKQFGTDDQFYIENRAFTVQQDVYIDAGQVDAEYQAVPEISRKIAQRAAEILVDRW